MAERFLFQCMSANGTPPTLSGHVQRQVRRIYTIVERKEVTLSTVPSLFGQAVKTKAVPVHLCEDL